MSSQRDLVRFEWFDKLDLRPVILKANDRSSGRIKTLRCVTLAEVHFFFATDGNNGCANPWDSDTLFEVGSSDDDRIGRNNSVISGIAIRAAMSNTGYEIFPIRRWHREGFVPWIERSVLNDFDAACNREVVKIARLSVGRVTIQFIVGRMGRSEITAERAQRIGALQFFCVLQLAIGGTQLASLSSDGREMWGCLFDGRDLRAATQDEGRDYRFYYPNKISHDDCLSTPMTTKRPVVCLNLFLYPLSHDIPPAREVCHSRDGDRKSRSAPDAQPCQAGTGAWRRGKASVAKPFFRQSDRPITHRPMILDSRRLNKAVWSAEPGLAAGEVHDRQAHNNGIDLLLLLERERFNRDAEPFSGGGAFRKQRHLKRRIIGQQRM